MMKPENIAHALRLVFWETTTACNLECIHCRRLDVSQSLSKDDLTTDESLQLIDSIREIGTPILVLSGGEPLVRPDIFDIAKYATNKGLITALATNGTLINDEIALKIKESGIHRVSISIDGADSNIHDNFRGIKGSFAQAINGLNILKSRGIGVQINSTIAKHNAFAIEKIYELAIALGADALHFFMLVPVGCGVNIVQSHQLEAKKYEELLGWIFEKSLENKIQIKATCAPHYFRIMKQKQKQLPPLKKETQDRPKHAMSAITKGCLAGTAVCFISHKGDVFPCGYLPVSAGNIRNEALEDIWNNSSVFIRLRNSKNLTGKCLQCEYHNVCMGCRARAYYQSGDYMAEEPFCIYQPGV